MAELRISEAVKVTHPWADAHELSRVILWDIGPEQPRPPAKPVPPKGKDGDPEFELAKVEFQQEIDDYRVALLTYKRLRQEYADWHTRNGGPIELDFWSIDAQHALDSDARAVKAQRQSQKRYYLSSRTRGHSQLPNRGLPKDLKPGHGQADLERRMREGDADLATALRADPVFGVQELRQ